MQDLFEGQQMILILFNAFNSQQNSFLRQKSLNLL
jgi:hypothetical protein